MEAQEGRRSEEFLRLYRMLEGLLEKRYVGRRVASGSVVMEYLHDADSVSVRTDLDMCREIRNLLAHNADGQGEPVVEPSEAVLETLRGILEYVQRPCYALEFGTPGERIMFAHPNDAALDVMRHMMRMGYSHVPVRDRTGIVGVFSAGSLMRYAGEKGLDSLRDTLRIGDLKAAIGFGDERSDKYLFYARSTTITAVWFAFQSQKQRNSHLAAVFITEDGTQHSPVLAMLTPWDVLRTTT